MQPNAKHALPPLPDARIVGDTLVASLPDAAQPVVWRLPLGQVKASAIEVRETGGMFTLVLKAQDGQTQDIASYAAKTDAVRALTTLGHAMFGAAVPAIAASPRKRRGRWILGSLALLAIVYLLLHGPRRISDVNPTPVPGDTAGAPNPLAPQTGAAATGVPQSADSFLQQQGQ